MAPDLTIVLMVAVPALNKGANRPRWRDCVSFATRAESR